MEFKNMNISDKTINALKNIGYLEATEVQEKTIPLMLQEKEIVVRSKTGSGKTAVFGVGLTELISKNKGKTGLIVVPTRELAIQITNELRSIGKDQRMRVYAVYGGQDINRQITLIRGGFDVIVATPGRMLDHIRRKTVNLRTTGWVVLDEADLMLDMGFKEDIDYILKETSPERKLFLFSATIDHRIKSLSRHYMNDPEIIEIGSEEVAEIEEKTIILKRKEKIAKLIEVLKNHAKQKVIIFVSTQRSVEFVHGVLDKSRISAEYIHGGKSQKQRERTMDGFKRGNFDILVATDVASRGLHIENVELIISFDKAFSADVYRHRIGRTGRMGKKGKSIEFEETDPYVPKYQNRGPHGFHRQLGKRRRSNSVYTK